MELALPSFRRFRSTAPPASSRRRVRPGESLPSSLARAVAARGPIAIRRAQRDDAAGVARLAALLGRRVPAGELLVAEADGAILAALPLPEGQPLVDPFEPTGDLVELLRLRARQLAA